MTDRSDSSLMQMQQASLLFFHIVAVYKYLVY